MSDERVYYDLLEINGTKLPDVELGKGAVSVGKEFKYNEYETEGGGKVIEEIDSEGKLRGSVSFSGMLQSQIQTIEASIDLVSEMKIYNPRTGSPRSFLALITPADANKIIHDAGANAWSYGFDFEEIGDIEDD